MKLITAAECVRKLRQAGIYKGKESYFSQLVQKGVISYHTKEGSPKKWYVLDEVKQSLRGWEDPIRDAQREANDRKRQSFENGTTNLKNLINYKLNLLKNIPFFKIEMFSSEDLNSTEFLEDMSIEEFSNELDVINNTNILLKNMADYYIQDIAKFTAGNETTKLLQTIGTLDFLISFTFNFENFLSMYGVSKCND